MQETLRPPPGAEVHVTLLLRVYSGGNTRVTDMTAPLHSRIARFILDKMDGALMAVGRVCVSWSLAKPPLSDPTAKSRLAKAQFNEFEWRPDVRTPELPALQTTPEAIVAVHGTMACGITLAKDIYEARSGKVPVARYEHDTWLRVADNARELAEQIPEAGLQRVVFVAHSRGGLVSRLAMELLERDHPNISTELIALGTPFAGTPVIEAARGGIIGVNALLGVLGAFGGQGIDIATRLTGFLIGSELPPGLQAMQQGSDLVTAMAGRQHIGITAFGGAASPAQQEDTYAVRAAAAFTRPAFNDGAVPNDYVIPTESAFAGVVPANTTRLVCDHFSYMEQTAVTKAIQAIPFNERLAW